MEVALSGTWGFMATRRLTDTKEGCSWVMGRVLKGSGWLVFQCFYFPSSLVPSVSSIKCGITLQCGSSNPDCKNKKNKQKHYKSLQWRFRTKLVMCIVST